MSTVIKIKCHRIIYVWSVGYFQRINDFISWKNGENNQDMVTGMWRRLPRNIMLHNALVIYYA